MRKKAIILLSGGLDSATCLAIAKSLGFDPYALTFAYGQKHRVEVDCAKQIANHFGVIEHKVQTLPIGEYGGSSLTDANLPVGNYQKSISIPNTYVPARNTIFLSFAVSWGEVIGAYDIFYGANYIDYSNYPDCRPDYLDAFENLANLGTKVGVERGQRFKIHAPLLHMNKSEIIHEGTRLGINFASTVSCYRSDEQGRACGCCDSCTFRKEGFLAAQMKDPTIYY